MAKKKRVGRPKGPTIAWSDRVADTIHYSYFWLSDELNEYCEVEDPEIIHGMIGYVAVLRAVIERYPIWPRSMKFGKYDLEAWHKRITQDIDVAAKHVPTKYRQEFKDAVNDDLDFLAEFLERKRDRATDA